MTPPIIPPQSELDLLSCPFCGKPPETFGSGEGQRGLMIECITSGCVNPHVSYYEHEAAIQAWNTRRAALNPKEQTDDTR